MVPQDCESFGTRERHAVKVEALLKDTSQLIVAKGKKVQEFAVGSKVPADAVAAMLGPTGNLRAPTARAEAALRSSSFERVDAIRPQSGNVGDITRHERESMDFCRRS